MESRHRARIAALLLPALSACVGATAPDLPVTEVERDCAQETADAGLPFDPAPAVTPELAELALTIRVPRERLLHALDSRVPEVLARGGRRVSVGRLSYSVRRGPFGLGLRGNALVVEVPIRVAASVCVPLGTFCPSVGGCSPALTTTVQVPLALNRRYELGPSRVATDLQRGCSIAGYDATGQIRQNAQRQSAQLKRQVDRLLPSIRPEMAELWAGLQQPLPLEGDACLVADPKQVVQYPAELSAEHLVFRLSVLTTLEEQRPCRGQSRTADLRPLPPPNSSPASERRGVLAVGRRVTWDEVSSQLRRAVMAGKPPLRTGVRVTDVRVTGARVPGPEGKPPSARVALSLRVEGSGCGLLWLLANPHLDDAAPLIRLGEMEPAGDTDQPATPELILWMQEHGLLDPGPGAGPTGAADALRAVVVRATTGRAAGLKVARYSTSPTKPTSPLSRSVAAGAAGLILTHRSEGELVLTVR